MKWIRFIAALILATGYRQWRDAKALFVALGTPTTVPDLVKARRLAVCEQCPIFYRPLRTCGSPLTDPEKGCYCQMDVKAGTDTNCWSYDNGRQEIVGWPNALNSNPHE